MYSEKTVLTGIKPTGTPHLGNMVGAVKPVIELSSQAKRVYVFIADLHALNAVRDSKAINRNTYEIAATFLALGLDTSKAALFRQSDIPEVYALSTLLMNVTAKGLMNRSHAYKAVVDRNIEKGDDPDAGVNMGLFTYPTLMAADILLYNADVVPVGQDQKQHVEFARDISGSFNHIYNKQILSMPEPVIQKTANAIPGLDGRKMSKSYDNYIPIFAEASQLKKLVMRIVTDSKLPHEPKDPDSSTIFQLYQNFATADQIAFMRNSFIEGKMGYGDAKNLLLDAINQYLEEPRKIYEALLNQPEKLDEILAQGAAMARISAKRTLEKVTKAMLGRSPSY
ncbi:MAG: tryptophan--tRNA ligase [Methylophilaceae bacterium]